MKYYGILKKSIAGILAFGMAIGMVSTTAFAATKKTSITSATAVSSASVKLKWKKISSVNGYEIYQKKSGEKYKKIKTVTSKNTTAYTVKKLTSATKYSYKIRTYKTVKNKKQFSSYSAVKSVTTKPDVPVLTSAVFKDNSVNVQWTEISGAKGYVLYKTADKVKTKIGSVSAGKTEFSFSGNAGETITARAYLKDGTKTVYSEYSAEITVVEAPEEAPQEPEIPSVDNDVKYVTEEALNNSIDSLKSIVESGYVTKEKLDEHIEDAKKIVENNCISKEEFLQYCDSVKSLLDGCVTKDVFNNYCNGLEEILSKNYITEEKLTEAIDELKEYLKSTYVSEEKVQNYLQELKTIFENSYVTPAMMEEFFGEIQSGILQDFVTEETLEITLTGVKSDIEKYCVTKENLDTKLTQIRTEIVDGYVTKEQLETSFNDLETLISYGYVSHEAIADYMNDIFACFDDYALKEDIEKTVSRYLGDIKVQLQKLEAAGQSPLKWRSIAVLGDSISFREWYDGGCYTQLIENKTGCTFIDYALPGSRIAERKEDTKDSFVERYSAMDDSAKAVIVMGGTNDFNTIKLGDFNSTDNTTFYGAMNELLTGLLTKYKGKPIIFFSPIKTAYTDYTAPVTEYEVKQLSANAKITKDNIAAAMSLKCRQYGIKCVDLASEAGINGYDPDRIYFKDDLHPTNLGMKRIAGVVQTELEKQFLY